MTSHWRSNMAASPTWTCVCLTFHFKSDVCCSGGICSTFLICSTFCPFVRHLLSGWVNSYWHPCLPFPSPFFLLPATQQSWAAGQPPKQTNSPGTSKEPSSQQSTQQQPRRSPGEAQEQQQPQQEQPTSRQRDTPYIFLLRPPGGPN